MFYLLIVSLIWAISFSLIKGQLTSLDSNFVSFSRMIISFLIFLPFLRIKKINPILRIQLISIGMIQYGIMYVTYIYSYQFLKAYQVALFTIFTPLYVTLINDFLTRRLHAKFLFVAALSVLGTAIIVYKDFHDPVIRLGFILMQISNIAFASGQIFYKRIMSRNQGVSDFEIYALLYLGAVLVTGIFASFTTNWASLSISLSEAFSLLYLGVIASGLGFFLWNVGARKSNAGTLAILNNAKIPLAIAVAVFFFSDSGNITRRVIGTAVIFSAILFNELVFSEKD